MAKRSPYEYLRKLNVDTIQDWPDKRPTFEEVAFGVAFLWSSRSTCDRLAAGCVAMNADREIVATGYNGAPRGMEHCSGPDGVGHLMVEGHCLRTLHSEHNMIIQAGRHTLKGTRVFLTARPCAPCTKMLVQSGVGEIHYWYPYNTDAAEDQVEKLAKDAGIPIYGSYVNDIGDRIL